MTTLVQALEFHRRGLSVIPVPLPRRGAVPGCVGDGKVPAIAWKQYQEHGATEDELRRWFSIEQNVAIVTGSVSGIVVVDADSPESVKWMTTHLPRTPWQTKSSRGFHAFYGHPGVPVRNRARIQTRDGRLALDVRGDGGYVIAPGSLHASGVRYEFAGDWDQPREALPRFWLGWLERPGRWKPTRLPTPTPRSGGDVVKRARAYLAAIPRPVLGQGSDPATFGAACRLVRGFALDPETACDLLQEWAPTFDRWWLERKVACASRYASEPVGGLR